MTGGVAAAAPQPTVAQVQQKLKQLNSKSERLDQQYDQVEQNLSSASQRLSLINREIARDTKSFDGMRKQVASIAATAYEEGSMNSSVALLTSGNAQQILDQSSILLELSAANSAEMKQFISAARQLTQSQQAAQRTKAGIVALRNSLRSRKKSLHKLISQQTTLLDQLDPAQQAGLGPGGGSGTGGYTGPTNTQGEKALAYAEAQLGCPYVYAGTGPCEDGYDCSGLTMMSWAAAGVSIPRTSYEQWDDLPHIPMSEVKLGDILVFNDEGHVGLFAGYIDGTPYLVDAPHTGADVEKVPMTGWYAETFDGALAP
jgi:cell wall-associated NlpC family hydrolase